MRKLNILIGKIRHPGIAYCEKCGKDWQRVQPHIIMYTPRLGAFVLCMGCWNNSSSDERVRYMRVVHGDRREWYDIERAIILADDPTVVVPWAPVHHHVITQLAQSPTSVGFGCPVCEKYRHGIPIIESFVEEPERLPETNVPSDIKRQLLEDLNQITGIR